MAGKAKRRRDNNRIALKKGESQRPNGTYDYRWVGKDGRRHAVYAKTLEELRTKEEDLSRDEAEGIRTDFRKLSVDDVYNMWAEMKRGLRDNTFQSYKYCYTMFASPAIGKMKIVTVKKSDIKRLYNKLVDDRNLSEGTMDSIHTVLHQVFDVAVDDEMIRSNPTSNVLREMKLAHVFHTEKRKALTVEEQDLFLTFLKESPEFCHWYPVFAVMTGTGLRVGECTGLRWCDVDLDGGMIDVNHTLVYYNHETNGCYFNVHPTKTNAGTRTVPILDFVKEAFLMEKKFQEENGIKCKVTIDGYTDFIFVNRFGNAQHLGTLNKAIHRITRICNDQQINKYNEAVEKAKKKAASGHKEPEVPYPTLLPSFTCHSLRHTFTTRMVEAGVNVKVIQDALGHADITTTLNIYADVTKSLKKDEFTGLNRYFKENIGKKLGESEEGDNGNSKNDA